MSALASVFAFFLVNAGVIWLVVVGTVLVAQRFRPRLLWYLLPVISVCALMYAGVAAHRESWRPLLLTVLYGGFTWYYARIALRHRRNKAAQIG